jgi:NAD(P)H-nitrite reductase large subunit
VIGGGLIGIEAVEVALAAGLRPSFFIREEWFWPMALEPREAAWIAERMTEHGVDVHLNDEVVALEADAIGAVSAVLSNQGRFEADCVVIAIGVVPNTEWLLGSVRWFDGSRRPEQLWYTARDQGRVAAAGLLGKTASYSRGTWYNSAKLMDIEYTTAGLVGADLPDESSWFFEEKGVVRSTTRIVSQNGQVVGFNMLGRRWDHNVLIRWIEERRSLSWVLPRLQHAAFDTELVPPLRVPAA